MLTLLERAAELLFPPKCVFCRTLLTGEESGLCRSCQKNLPWLSGAAAETTGEFFSLCISPLRYEQDVRESIRRYKFSGAAHYAGAYGPLLARCVREHLSALPEVVTWAPLSKKRLRQRGYDQAALLARAAAGHLNLPAVPLLAKTRHIRPQSSLSGEAAARRANVLGAYQAACPEQTAGRRVLLVDDVVTSGSTLSECARILRAAGAADVVCCTLAKAGK